MIANTREGLYEHPRECPPRGPGNKQPYFLSISKPHFLFLRNFRSLARYSSETPSVEQKYLMSSSKGGRFPPTTGMTTITTSSGGSGAAKSSSTPSSQTSKVSTQAQQKGGSSSGSSSPAIPEASAAGTSVQRARGAFTRAKTVVGLEVSSAESSRMTQDGARVANWKRWGPYLSERQWATVREDYSPNGSW